ncbi:restriction endonuclease subunit S [Streptomyces sp. NPDC005246]|uniref:restriction endonuclease subunit S n=1 Tax=Streptomyces sp. NPDC005246 TaxID=3156716 RepID=UPI0033A329BF
MITDTYTYPTFPLRRFITSITDGPFGSSLTSNHYSDTGARVVRLGNIGSAQFKDHDAAFIPLDYYKQLQQHVVRSGDLLIAGLGDTNNPVGRACVAPDHLGPAIVKADCFRARLDEDRLTHRYAAWALSSSFVSDQVSTLTRGSTRARINLEVAREVQLPNPPLEEQWRIATFLDAETTHIDRLVSLQTAVLARLDERDRALRDGLLDRLLDTVDEVPLRRFVTRIDQGSSPQCEAVPRTGHEWGVLKLSAVKNGRFIPTENKRLPDEVTPRREYEVHAGDLLVTRANTPSLVGDVAVAMGDVKGLLLPDLIYRVGLVPGINPEFITEIALGSRVRLLIEAVARGSSQSMVKLRGDDIREWPIPAATQAQQASLVVNVRQGQAATDRLRGAIHKQLTLLAERRQSLITAAVTGQIDVSTASGRGIDPS